MRTTTQRQNSSPAAETASLRSSRALTLPAVPVLQPQYMQPVEADNDLQDNTGTLTGDNRTAFVPVQSRVVQYAAKDRSFITGEGEPSEAGAISKSVFLTDLQKRISIAADGILQQINQTSADCPYIAKWFAHYAEQDAAHISKAIARFAPGAAGADTVDTYMDAIVNRVRNALQEHVNTGSTDDIPPEILEQPHQPGDFKHIADKAQGVAQLSGLIARLRGPAAAAPAAAPVAAPRPPRAHAIIQGHTAVAQAGERVFNVGTTSCGLVLGFGATGIACFHWPFMTDSPEHHATFREICAQVAPINRVEIITNDFPNADARRDYTASARSIEAAAGVTTAYYVRDGQLIGDPWGMLTAAHLNSTENLRQIF